MTRSGGTTGIAARRLFRAMAVAWLIAACARCAPAEPDRAVGSASATAPAVPDARPVTFAEDVAPILFEHCATCHRPVDDAAPQAVSGPGSAEDPLCVAGAPFSVLDYASVRGRARAIARAVTSRAMPPWLPAAGHGEFVNERRLSDREIALIARWSGQGAPQGDPARMPPAPPSRGGWLLGKPDLVLTLQQPYELKPGARDVFRNFVLKNSLTSVRYVRGVEFRADNPRVLHHANLAVDPGRVGRALDRADAGAGFASMPDDDTVQNVYGWSPGKIPVLDPADTAWTLEPGADLVVQLHMVASDAPQPVQPAIGLFFADTPPTRTPIAVKLESKAIDIPAGAAHHVVEDRYVLPVDVDVVSVYPHAHSLATEMRGVATLPDGSTTPLIWIPQWDIRWQDQYRYRTPLFLPKGTTLSMHFVYDNSSANPNNRQRSPQRVRWGPLSTDEMGALWLEVVPRRPEDASVLTADYFRRALQADLDSAELAVRSDPRDAGARNRLAMKYVQAGRIQDAQAQLEQALRVAPDHAEAHSNLGTVLQAQGRLAEATRHLQEAVRLKPADDRMHFNLGNGLLAAGDPEGAIREFRAAIARNGDNADAHFNLAMLLGPRNQTEEAIAHLRRVVDLAPRNGDAYRNLALGYALTGRLDEAIEAGRAAVRLLPHSAEARAQLESLLAARTRR